MKFDYFQNNICDKASDSNTSLEIIQRLISEYFKGKFIPYVISLNSFVVRCSINDFNSGEVFMNTSRCSYPPKELSSKIRLQRANFPRQQVFYCSTVSDTDFAKADSTCLMETLWEHIEDFETQYQYATLSRWNLSRPLRLWALPFNDLCCSKNRDVSGFRDNFLQRMKVDTFSRRSYDALRWLSDLFVERENKEWCYRITSAFYNYLLARNKNSRIKMDGLLYASANTEGAGVNIALRKEIIDRKIAKCVFASMVKMVRNPGNKKDIFFDRGSNDSWAESNGRLRFTTIF